MGGIVLFVDDWKLEQQQEQNERKLEKLRAKFAELERQQELENEHAKKMVKDGR